MASVSRMVARNWLPRPSPLLAPATRPAMSTNSMAAGTTTFGLGDFLEHIGPLVRHDDHADIGVDGAEGVVGRLRLPGAGEGVEEGGFAHIGQSDDAGFEHKIGALKGRMQRGHWGLDKSKLVPCILTLFPAKTASL